LEAEAPPEWGGAGAGTITISHGLARCRGDQARGFVTLTVVGTIELAEQETEAPPDADGAEFKIITTSRGLARSRRLRALLRDAELLHP
jgi:hypothetical protein